jgi:UDP-N-acetylglucosamine acyltransferase
MAVRAVHRSFSLEEVAAAGSGFGVTGDWGRGIEKRPVPPPAAGWSSHGKGKANRPGARPDHARVHFMIHPTAIVDPEARLDPTVTVGPYAVIGRDVELGPHCIVGPHVVLWGRLRAGAHNRFHAGCVIGDAPQDLKYKDAPTGLVIGDHNVFREHVTVHRSNRPEEDTRIGSHNFLMAHCHVAHNCVLGDHVIVANGALLGGHVIVEDRAFISGNCLVHQFVRVGTLALMQGGSAISLDLPPFTGAWGDNALCGLNVVGLRRAGISAGERLELRRLYRLLFRQGLPLREAVQQARQRFSSPAAQILLQFVENSRRGLCRHLSRQRPGGAEAEAEAEPPEDSAGSRG